MGKQRETKTSEKDSAYLFKIVLYIILGSLWIKFADPIQITEAFSLNGLPLGLVIGLFFASHDHFAIDRKIEYAILLVMTVASLYLPVGIIV